MSKFSIAVVLPMRAGSKRVPHKNMRTFGPYTFGLAENKLRQLLQLKEMDEIIIDTDEPSIEDLLSLLRTEGHDLARVRLEKRDADLAGDLASTDDLIAYLGQKVKSEYTLWTHVTSPFTDADVYSKAIATFRENCLQTSFDSLMSVTALQEFIWTESGPINYDYAKEKWPRTQTLPQWFFINSAIFIAPTALLTQNNNRIGERPFLFAMDKVVSLDVDNIDDFVIAESLMKYREGCKAFVFE